MFIAIVGLLLATKAHAVTVDGTRDDEYGAAISVQAVETGFGNANPPTVLGGSELDAAYARITGGRLYLMFTGNHEPNFNKLDIFIDSVAGGENTFSSTPEYDYQPSPGNWISENLGTMVMDAGIDVDYHLFSRWGGATNGYEVDFVNRAGGVNAMVPGASETSAPAVGLIASGSIPAGDLGPNASASSLTQPLAFAINNNNTAGVDGCDGSGCLLADQVAAAAVTTGMEFSIALADLGNPSAGSTIRISAMISNGDHNYLSNQVLGSFMPVPPPDPPGQHNPGGNGNNPNDPFNAGGFTGTMAGMNFNNFPGTQYFSIVVPEEFDGDHNEDGFIDAADYVAWRKMDGDDEAGYLAFKKHFGEPSPGIGGGSGSVPEPGSLVLAMLGGLLALTVQRRR
jgi:hypothetical protein